MDKVFKDVRIFYAQALINTNISVKQMHVHENLKEREYSSRGMAVEKGIVFNANSGMAR